MTGYSKDISPVGWYVASYVLRFIELDAPGNDDLDGEFPVWENTVIVRAGNLDDAYKKVVALAESETAPYKGGDEGVPVQWLFEGVTELLPIYEPLEDGAEIMWEDHEAVRLSELRQRAKPLSEIKEHLGAKSSD